MRKLCISLATVYITVLCMTPTLLHAQPEKQISVREDVLVAIPVEDPCAPTPIGDPSSVFYFNTPVKAPMYLPLYYGANIDFKIDNTLCGRVPSDINFKVGNSTRFYISGKTTDVHVPYNVNFVFGTDGGEGVHRIRMLHTGIHGYIDYKDNLHFRADKNWISALTLYGDGTVGVGFGTTYNAGHYKSMGYKLAVNGGIICEEVKVVTDVPDADFVFEEDYNLAPLSDVEDFIKENKHLPNIPSAEEFKTNGYNVGEMDGMLLRKIEELTLYIIKQEKQTIEQQKLIEALQKRLSELESKKGGE
jgi:hypothetical protein